MVRSIAVVVDERAGSGRRKHLSEVVELQLLGI
jgi:hypothetical protein